MPSLGGIKAGKAFVIIEAVDQTAKVMGKIRRNLINYGKEFEALGRRILTRSILAITPTFFASKIFMDFDDAMKKVEARSRGTGAEMDQLRDQAKKLGRETAYTAAEIGNLQMVLAQKGFNRGQIKAMTPGIMRMGQATAGIDQPLGEAAGQAAQLVSGTIRAFKMNAEDATKVANIYTAAINNSNYTLEDMMTSMQYAGPIAREMGVSLEDSIAAMGVLANLNIDASIIGTAFRNIQNYMSSTKGRDEFNARIKEATGNTIEFMNANKNMKNLPAILFAIGQATQGMGNMEKSEALGKMFGVRASVPVMAFKDSVQDYAQLHKAIEDADKDNLADKTAQKMESGIGGAWREFLSGLEGVALAIGESLAPALIDLQNHFGVFLNNVTAWITAHPRFILGVTMSTIGFIALGATLIGVGTALKMFSLIARVTSATLFLLGGAVRLLGIQLLVQRVVLLASNAVWIAYRTYVAALTATMIIVRAAITATTVVISMIVPVIRMATIATMLFMGALNLMGQMTLIVGAIMFQVQGTYWLTVRVLRAMAVGVIFVHGALQALFYLMVFATKAILGINTAIVVSMTVMRNMVYMLQAMRIAWAATIAFIQSLSLGSIFTAMLSGVSSMLIAIGSSIGAFLVSPLGAALVAIAAIAALIYINRTTIFDVLVAGIHQASIMLTNLRSAMLGWFAETLPKGIALAQNIAKVFDGALTALTSGDTQAAWDIVVLGLETTWLQTMDIIKASIEDVTSYFADSWAMAGAIIVEVWKSMATTFGTLFDVATLGVSGTVSNLMDKATASVMPDMGAIPSWGEMVDIYSNMRDIGDNLSGKESTSAARKRVTREKRAEREAEITKKQAELDTKLKQIKDKAAAETKGAEDNVAGSIDQLATKLQAEADALINKGQVDTFIAPKANEATIRGTMDSAKEVYEAEMRDKEEGETLEKKAQDTRQAMLDTLKSIEENTGVSVLAMA